MPAGEYRHRITIERRSTGYDSLGHSNTDWKPIAKGHYCLVKDLSGRELELARQIISEVTVRITTRRSPAIEKDRIQFRGRTFNVLSATPNELGTEQTILCAEVKQG